MAKTILVMSHGKSLKVPASERDYFASLGYEVPDEDEDEDDEARVRALEAKRKGGARTGITAEGDDLL